MNPDRFTGAGTDQAAEAPFDRAAIEYDRLFEENPVTETIRPLVWRSMLNRFKPGSHILELNCGTGTDAIMLAGHGMHVTATDASAEMISQARSKIRQHHVESSVTLKRMNFEDIHSMNGETFDGAFSNFGGLNCARELPPTLAGLSAVMKPGSYFIACVMNRISLWEIISFLARGRWSAAFRRLRSGGVDISLNGSSLHVRYYSPGEFAKLLAPWFLVERIYGLNILSPSPNSRTFVLEHPGSTRRLLEFDNRIRFRFPWHSLGDHFVVESRRKTP